MNQNIDTICARLATAQPALSGLLRSPDVLAAAAALGLQPHQLAALATTGRAVFSRLCPGAEPLYERLHAGAGRFEPFNVAGGELVLQMMQAGGGDCSCQVPGGPPSTTPPSTTPPSTTPPSPSFPPQTQPPRPGDPCAPGVPPQLTPMDYNCRPASSDMTPCRAAKVMSEESIFDAEFEWNTGDLFAGGIVAMLLPAVGLSSRVCVDSIGASLNGTALPLTWVALQAQILTLDANGQAVQAWTSYRPARPGQISATDGRCPCARVCVCQGYASQVRVLLRVPAIAATDTLTVTVGGYREDWGAQECGPCPPCNICDLTALDEFEAGDSADKYELVYIPEGI